MAPLPVILNVERVAFNWTTVGAGSSVNVMHFRQLTPEADPVEQALQATTTPEMWGPVASDTGIRSWTITPLDGHSASRQINTVNTGQFDGQSTGGAVPGLAAIMKLQTAERGKSHQGRIFMPAVGEAANNQGRLTAGLAGSTTAAWILFVLAMAALEWQLMVASYKLESADVVTSTTCETNLATQRRRQSRLRL